MLRGQRWSCGWSATVGGKDDGTPQHYGRRAVTKTLSSRAERFPETLFAFTGAGSQGRVVLETCSPVHQYKQALGME